MKKITLPFFGTVETEYEKPSKDFIYGYSADLWGDEFKFREKPLDLHVHFTNLSEENIAMVASTLNDLGKIIDIGQKLLEEDYYAGKTVKEDIEEWIEYHLDEEPFKNLVKKPITEDTPIELLRLYRVVSISIYALDKTKSDDYILMDYAFDYDQDSGCRDNVVAISLDKNYDLIEIITDG